MRHIYETWSEREMTHCLCASASGRRFRPAMDARIFSLCSSDSGPRLPTAPLQCTKHPYLFVQLLPCVLHAHLPMPLVRLPSGQLISRTGADGLLAHCGIGTSEAFLLSSSLSTCLVNGMTGCSHNTFCNHCETTTPTRSRK